MRSSPRTAVAVLLVVLAAVAPAPSPTAQPAPERSLQGSFLVAPPDHDGGTFGRSVVFLLHHAETGAMGVIVNRKLSHENLRSLMDAARLGTAPRGHGVPDIDIVIRYGGPVGEDMAIAIHSPEFVVSGTMRIGEFAAVSPVPDVLAAIAEGREPEHYAVFAGHAGWAPAQLEAELARKWWIVVPAEAGILFDHADSTKWQRAFERRPIDL